MRESLTVLAVLLILVLATALVGPHFVDWTAQRPLIEAKLSSLLGRAITISGPIDVQLLPSPRLSIQAVELVPVQGQPEFSARQLKLELSPMPLLRGELSFVEAEIDQPKFEFAIARDGNLMLPFSGEAINGTTKFQHIRLTQARVRFNDYVSGYELNLDPFDFDGEAASLAGPFKGGGQIQRPSGPVGFRIALGSQEEARSRLRLVLEETTGNPQTEIDGFVSILLDQSGLRQPSFDGTAVVSGHLKVEGSATALPWRMNGPVQADRARLQAPLLDVRMGPEDGSIAATGTGEIRFASAPVASLNLVARQLDLDKLAALDIPPAALLDALQKVFAGADNGTHLPAALTIDATTPLINLGGQILPDASVRVSLARGQPTALRLTMNAPGRSTLALDGLTESGAAAGFRGDVQASTKEAQRLADWLEGLAPQLAQGLRALPFQRMELAGTADISAVHFSGRNLFLQLDRSNLNGALALTRAVGNEPARIFADLASPALDLDQAPDLSGLLAAGGGIDLSIALDARAVKVARIGEGVVDAGRIRGKLVRAGDALTLENFAIENLGGANLTAKGVWASGQGRLEASLDAQRLVDLTQLLRRLAPGAWAEALSERAVALSPAKIVATAEALTGAQGQPTVKAMALSGTLDATKIGASVRSTSADPAVKVVDILIDAPETWSLLRQLGIEANVYNGAGRGTVLASATGRLDASMDLKLDVGLAGTRLATTGKLRLEQAALSGILKADSANVSPLLRILGLVLPDAVATVPVALGGDFGGDWSGLNLTRLAGTIAGATVSGAAKLERIVAVAPARGDKPKLSGAFKLDRLAVSSLAALALGPPQTAVAGAVWSDNRFGAGLAAAPQTSLALQIGALELAKGLVGTEAQMRLELAPGIVALNDIVLKLNGSPASGQLVMRRDGPVAAISGKVSSQAFAVRLPSLEGLANFALELTATGDSAAGLAAGLAGSGQMTLQGGRVPGAEKGTIARLLALADKGQLTFEEGELKRTMNRELDKGALELGDQAFELAMAAGTLRLEGLDKNGPLKLALDIRNLTLDQRVTLAETVLPKEWTGMLPRMDITLKGALAAPVRDVEASNLINDIAAREIARDTAKIAALDADIRERAAFNRRAKAWKQQKQNEIDLLNYLAAEAKRVADELKRAAEEEARRLADEEKRRAADILRQERERRAAEEAARRALAPAVPGNALPPDVGRPLILLPRVPDPAIVAPLPPG